ncbi:MAG TPA: hypothetical protein PLY40_09280, partial [Bacillota bacterium]|nr:hypothetical protein [Bacillota bacterium]
MLSFILFFIVQPSLSATPDNSDYAQAGLSVHHMKQGARPALAGRLNFLEFYQGLDFPGYHLGS